MNVTYKQREMILDFMSKHIDVVRGRVSCNAESRSTLCWNDWKMNVLKKESKKRAHMQGTGGGPAAAINISDLEQKLLDILTPEAAGMPNIPEGGLISKTNQNSMINYPIIKPKEVAKTSNRPLHVNIQQDVDVQDVNVQQDIDTYCTQINYPAQPKKIAKISNRPSYVNVQQDVDDSQFPEILQYICDTSDLGTEAEIVEEKENVEIRPSKIKKVNKVVGKLSNTTDQNLTMTDMTLQMLQLQQEKIKMKKEELTVQKELFAVQKEILTEIKDFNMRGNCLETEN